ncbi:MAG: succinylglutamate desuccinylase [Bacteroidetes bacterium]|nr:MAG: succinylglutamate desuccinylase [Bacteroidota bacterium]
MERVIGRYTGADKGPLLIVFGGMHGNEPAGVEALEIMFRMLEVEPRVNPSFRFKGRLLGVRGNLQALKKKKRFIRRDLNRLWVPEIVEKVRKADPETLCFEEREMREILDLVSREIETYAPEKVVVLDIHTTTAFGGIFSIATDDPESLRIAVELHAPVITNMLEGHGLKGTSLHFFNTQNFGVNMVPVVFEAGQHSEQLSVNRSIAAITNCLRTIGCVRAEDVENRHDSILIEYSKGLPKVAKLVMIHQIKNGDKFKMRPNYKNFQPVRKGEVLAYDKNGEIRAQTDGMVLMPLYQKQGDDGFFLVQPVDY